MVDIVAGSTGPPYRFQILESDGATPVSLVDAMVRIRFAPTGQEALWEHECMIDIASEGKAHYDWLAGDLEKSGSYEIMVIVEYASGMIRHSEPFPFEIGRAIPAPLEPAE